MKKLLALLTALVMVFALCSFAAAEDLIKVGYAQVGHESDWRAANTANYQAVFTAENGFELSFVDCDNDNATQLDAVRNFIQQGLDYIIIAPIATAGWNTVLAEAKEAGIPVIIADRAVDADPSEYTAWVGTNMIKEGETAGKWLEEYMAGKDANILVIEGSVGNSAALGRTEGFGNIAKDHPEWKIVDSQSGDFTQVGGQQVMESYIKSYPGQFNVLVCQNDNEAYGAMDAMNAAGITYGVGGDVVLVSYDATKAGLGYCFEGKINADVECNPIQAETVKNVILQIEKGEAFELTTIVKDEAFCAPDIASTVATPLTQEILDGRLY